MSGKPTESTPPTFGNSGGHPQVSVRLRSGQLVTGELVSNFSPYASRHTVEKRSEAGRETVVLDAQDVAYVAFHLDPGEQPAPPTGLDLSRFHLEFNHDETLEVICSRQAAGSGLGFFAFPTGTASTFKRLYVYAETLRKKEKGESVSARFVQPMPATQDATPPRPTKPAAGTTPERSEDIEGALGSQLRRRMRLGESLVDVGLATAQDIEAALLLQKKRPGKKLGEILVEMGVLTEVEVSETLAQRFGLTFVDLNQFPVNPEAMGELPPSLLTKYGFLPIDATDKLLTIAISDPLARDVHDVLRFHVRKRIIDVLVTPSQLAEFTRRATSGGPGSEEVQRLVAELKESEADQAQVDEVIENNDSKVIRLVNQIILDGRDRGASDIHIEPNVRRGQARVRFRIDGDCVVYQEFPGILAAPLVARLKVMARADISERRKPQDGKITIRLDGAPLELRLVTLPTIEGNEDVVLRLLPDRKPAELEELGLSEKNHASLKEVIARPDGLILVVGPTGSGKTSTLHSVLQRLNTPDTKIWTAEDPVEITQAGLRQLQVNPKSGLTFATAMRAFLRADPDVIMFGELRDEETGSIALEAALTGHLVLSTLHTKSAVETLARLIDMGLEPFSVADALTCVVSQRLVKGLCPRCKERVPVTSETYVEMADAYGRNEFREHVGASGSTGVGVWQALGCGACAQSGYFGRVALHEVMVVEEPVRRALRKRAPVDELERVAIDSGMRRLVRDGIEKVLSGLTDLKQVFAAASARS